MKKIKNTGGFTLLEVLIAFSILVIGILGMTFLVTTVISQNRLINRMTTATILAQDKLEDIQSLGYSGTDSNDAEYKEDYNSIADHPHFKRVTYIDVDNPMSGMKTVTVKVYWDSDNKSVDLNTILYQ